MKAQVTTEQTFLDEAKKLPPDRRKVVICAIEKFMTEPALPSLKFRPLAGVDKHFIINAVHGDRVILRLNEDQSYSAVDVGPHDNVYRRLNRRK